MPASVSTKMISRMRMKDDPNSRKRQPGIKVDLVKDETPCPALAGYLVMVRKLRWEVIISGAENYL